MALRPDGQALLIAVDGTVSGMPPLSAACRAGTCPAPPCTTGQQAILLRNCGALVRHRGVFVHWLAGHAIGSGIALGSSAHEFVLDRAVEAVEGE